MFGWLVGWLVNGGLIVWLVESLSRWEIRYVQGIQSFSRDGQTITFWIIDYF